MAAGRKNWKNKPDYDRRRLDRDQDITDVRKGGQTDKHLKNEYEELRKKR